MVKDNSYEVQHTPLFPAAHNLLKQALTIKVNSDETITAQREVSTFGIFDQAQRYRFLYTPPELIRQSLKEKIQEVSIGAQLDTYAIKNLENLNLPVVLSYAFRGNEYFTEAGTLRIMPQLSGLDTTLVAQEKRTYAIDLGILESKETIFEVAIPENFAIKYIPGSVTQDNPWFRCSVEYGHQSRTLTCKQQIEFKKNFIPEGQYQGFKNSFETLAKKLKQRVILERIR